MAVFLMVGAMDPVTTKMNITMFSVVDYSSGFKADLLTHDFVSTLQMLFPSRCIEKFCRFQSVCGIKYFYLCFSLHLLIAPPATKVGSGGFLGEETTWL